MRAFVCIVLAIILTGCPPHEPLPDRRSALAREWVSALVPEADMESLRCENRPFRCSIRLPDSIVTFQCYEDGCRALDAYLLNGGPDE